MANRLDDQADPQTTDLPGAAPSPGVSVPTDRREETSRRLESVDDKTAPYVPAVGDASSVTGGYTPSDMPSTHGDKPTIPGYELLGELRPRRHGRRLQGPADQRSTASSP